MRRFYWVLIAAIVNLSANAQTFSLLKDINPGTSSAFPEYRFLQRFVNVNGVLFFVANNGIHGSELWKTDGTTAGTVMVKDIRPGTTGSNPDHLTYANGELFFTANDSVHGTELWKSDGSEPGTVLVKDIQLGMIPYYTPQWLTNVNGTIFFKARDQIHGFELWKSDGTTTGTVMVKDIGTDASSGGPQFLTNVNGTLFFSASDSHGQELWKSDGTASGTVLVKDIFPGGPGGPMELTNVDGLLFFSAQQQPANHELWKSDGTEAGTVLVKEINAGPYGSNPGSYTELNGSIYFRAMQSSTPFTSNIDTFKLWKTDGTATGTSLVKNIDVGSGFVYMNGALFFNGMPTVSGGKLWRTDGSEVGTVMVKDIKVQMSKGGSSDALVVNGHLFFAGDDGINGWEIWKSDGTGTGTFLLQNIVSGNESSDPQDIIEVNGKIFFTTITPEYGRELWVAAIPVNGALPSTLSNFKGQLSFNDGLLTWKTSSEQNASHFEIERSTDGRNFTKAGTVTAAGNSSATKQYNYTDRNIISLGASVVYYRLKMNDADGKFTYSKIIAINISSKEAVVMLYPNPVKESATLMIAVTRKENITYSIIDQSGRTLQQKNITVTEGSNMIIVETTSLVAGVYNIILKGTVLSSQMKFVKQ